MSNPEVALAFVASRPEFSNLSIETREDIAEACLNFAFKHGERHVETRRRLEATLERYREGMERGLAHVVEEREKAIAANALLQERIGELEKQAKDAVPLRDHNNTVNGLKDERVLLVRAIARSIRDYSGYPDSHDLKGLTVALPAHMKPLWEALKSHWAMNAGSERDAAPFERIDN